MLLILFILSVLVFYKFNVDLAPYFSKQNRFDELQTLVITLCGAMLVLTAIAASFIMFAMQVNVERMPYGLFKKFSSDIRLLLYFFFTFITAIVIGVLPIIFNISSVTIIVLGVGWSLGLIVTLVFLAYKRALKLICPTEQLLILVAHTKNHLNYWSKAAERYKSLLVKQSKTAKNRDEISSPNYDIARFEYFNQFPQWTHKAAQAMQYAFSLAKYHARQGDHESVQAALQAVVDINSEYIIAKGKTFFPYSPLDPSLSADVLINEMLESLRKYIQIGVSRRDEQQITLSFNAIHDLCLQYLKIDYSTIYPVITHANSAAAYLTSAIESIIPHKMTDVVMEGIRLIKKIASSMVEHGNVD
ncbi:MAG: hypothetical protein KAT71_06280, partial [Gammaproteobacteria bacterium]|nr:hypothetical protein [Gammaproteobacteria bacterium]